MLAFYVVGKASCQPTVVCWLSFGGVKSYMLILAALGGGSVPLAPDIIPGSTVHEVCADSPVREMQIKATLTFHISSIKGVFVELI